MLVGDALPDARRGLCPLDQAVLDEMRRRGQVPTRPYRKCSGLIDDVGGSGVAAWERILTLAQDFVTRYPLIDSQGNFGSIDGDPPADPVYTECRLSHAGLAAADGGRFPSLLVNGAVGSRTVIPPHNLEGVARAVSEMLGDPGTPAERLVELVGGPDFATGGVIADGDPLVEIYRTGRGRLVLEGRTQRVGRDLVVTELPYGVSKGGDGGLILEIADLVRDRELPALADLRDDSDRDGMQLVVTPESEQGGEELRQALLELTRLRVTLDVDMVAIVDGDARAVALRDLITAHIEQRRSILGADSDDRIRAELDELAAGIRSPRRTTLGV